MPRNRKSVGVAWELCTERPAAHLSLGLEQETVPLPQDSSRSAQPMLVMEREEVSMFGPLPPRAPLGPKPFNGLVTRQAQAEVQT